MTILDNSKKNIRVLMIGPGEGVGGGIFTLVETFLPELTKRVDLNYLVSVQHRPLKDSGKFSLRNFRIAFSQYARYAIALHSFRPNIVHLHSSQGIAWLKDTLLVILGKMAGCRVVVHMHGGNFDQIYDLSSRFIQAYTRKVLGWADAIITVSAECKKRLIRIVCEDKVFSLRNCIDIEAFKTNYVNLSRSQVNILFLGRIGRSKGTYDLVEAFRALCLDDNRIHLWLVGPEEDQGESQKVSALIENYHLEQACEIVGEVDRKQVLNFFREASFFVLPSYYEGLPMVVLEAMAAGLPVITTAVGGIPEVVKDGLNGFLIPVGDTQTLKSRINSLIWDPCLRETMGKCSREITEREFSVPTYVDQLIGVYSNLVQN